MSSLFKSGIVGNINSEVKPFVFDGNSIILDLQNKGKIITEINNQISGIKTMVKNATDYINRNKSDYYRLFTEFRENNNYEDWIIYILKGIEETSKNTINLIKKIEKNI